MKPWTLLFRGAAASMLMSAAAAANAFEWPAWDRAELAETQGRVDPEAAAEVLHYSIEVDHSDFYESTEDHYVRVKLFKASALEQFAKIEVPYDSDGSIKGLMARTMKPDGTILELNKKDIVDREVVKVGRERMRVKAFAPAGLEPGVILEYRYVKQVPTIITWLTIQGPNPVREFRCKVRPYGSPYLSMSSYTFRCPGNTGFVLDKKSGYSSFAQDNFPAVREEPLSPPEVETKASILLFYSLGKPGFGAEHWETVAADMFTEGRRLTKRNKAVDAAAASIVSASDPPEVKLRKFFDFCRTQIKNPYVDTAALTREERLKLRTIRSPSDTLKYRKAGAEDINLLFAALAATTGLETRLALVNNRGMIFAAPDTVSNITMNRKVVAVRIDGAWQLYDPGFEYVPFGMLAWPYNDTCYLVAEQKEGKVALRDGPASDKSVRHRRADFTLDENGTLEGEVRMSFTGLWEAEMKEDLDDRTQEAREESLKEEITALLPRAEVTDIRVENAADPVGPLRINYHLRVPAYAERVGSRLFVQPGVFQKGSKPLFTEKTRESNIIFKYRYTESDVVTITIPEGYLTEVKAAPKSQAFGSLCSYRVTLGTGKDPRTLVYKRELAINAMGIVAKHYDTIRGLFEMINEQDGHLLTLRRNDAESEPAQATATTVTGPTE